MLSRLAKTSRYMLPVLFFGYAAAANTSLLWNGGWTEFQGTFDTVMTGAVTRKVEEVYKTELPHREPSIGLLGALRYQLLRTGKPGVIVGTNDWFYSDEEFRPEINSAERIDRSIREIHRIRDRLAVAGTELLVVPLPHKSDVYPENLSTVFDRAKGHEQYTSFVQRLTDSGIHVADTRHVLTEGKAEQPVFFKTDTHWTPYGARLVAEKVAEAAGSLKTWNETDFELAEAEAVSFWGDLVSFVTDEDYGSMAGLEQENAVLWQASAADTDGAVDLFGAETEFPVVLVGSSYSANKNWSFAEFLKDRMSVDVLNVAEEGQGPGTPMFAYLNGDEFAAQKPALVIWEFPTRYIAQDLLWENAPASEDKPKIALAPSPDNGGAVQ
jgi:alginate O-acetyltransferase complex protein AlgJ